MRFNFRRKASGCENEFAQEGHQPVYELMPRPPCERLFVSHGSPILLAMGTADDKQRFYVAIDLKSFYASVECAERGLDALTTNLVVADKERTEKTICLAVSPSLKAHGISGRARLFEVVQAVKRINAQRKAQAPGHKLVGSSSNADELDRHPELALDYVVAVPRMALYLQRSTEIYEIYLRHVAPEDIHVYSIDEVFIDVTGYLRTAGMTAHEFAAMLVRDVLEQTGITATVGIGTNLYLAKVAMDIVAKHMPAGADGARIAELDEMGYRRRLWDHRPLTDFWRVGRATARKLDQVGIGTMGEIARASIAGPHARKNEDLLYDLFGVNAELLIDHAWGWEPCTLADVRAYRPESSSFGSGQVLQCPYPFDKTRLVMREMAEQLSLDLVEKGLATSQITITVGYDRSNLEDPAIASRYEGEVTTDFYGRSVPKHAHGSVNLPSPTSSSRLVVDAALSLFDSIVDPRLLARRLNITAGDVTPEEKSVTQETQAPEQLDLLVDYDELERTAQAEDERLEEERRRQEAILAARRRFGKNAVLKGTNLQEGATQTQRNKQIGGHRA